MGGKLAALYNRHKQEVSEMRRRNYAHHSPLDKNLAVGKRHQGVMINTLDEQLEILKNKGCECIATT